MAQSPRKPPTETEIGRQRRADQEQRLANELRRNLLRRKAQTRHRQTVVADEPTDGEDSASG